jgi:hypothetical protein
MATIRRNIGSYRSSRERAASLSPRRSLSINEDNELSSLKIDLQGFKHLAAEGELGKKIVILSYPQKCPLRIPI